MASRSAASGIFRAASASTPASGKSAGSRSSPEPRRRQLPQLASGWRPDSVRSPSGALAVWNDGKVARSSDGKSWSEQPLVGAPDDWISASRRWPPERAGSAASSARDLTRARGCWCPPMTASPGRCAPKARAPSAVLRPHVARFHPRTRAQDARAIRMSLLAKTSRRSPGAAMPEWSSLPGLPEGIGLAKGLPVFHAGKLWWLWFDGGRSRVLSARGWRPLSREPLPPRDGGVAVSAGKELILFGGFQGKRATNEGARVSANGRSAALTVGGGPSARGWPARVWTGEELLVWGGRASRPLADGFAYSPGCWSAATPFAVGRAPARRAVGSSRAAPPTIPRVIPGRRSRACRDRPRLSITPFRSSRSRRAQCPSVAAMSDASRGAILGSGLYRRRAPRP